MLALLAIIFTVMTYGAGATLAIGVIGTVGINAYFVYEAYQDYKFKQTAAGAGLSTDDASPFWLIVAVAGAVVDLSVVGKALGEISPLLKSFTKAEDITRFRNGLNQLKIQERISAKIADAVSIAADIQKGSLEASEALIKAFTENGAGALLKADTYGQLVKYAYYSFRNGVNSFEQYYLNILKLRSEAKITAEVTSEELTKLKRAFEEGKNLEKDADLLKYMEVSSSNDLTSAKNFSISRTKLNTAGEKLFDAEKLERIGNSLSKQGIQMKVGKTAEQRFKEAENLLQKELNDPNLKIRAFYEIPPEGGPGTLYFRENPTESEVIEELLHVGQHRKINFGIPTQIQQVEWEMDAQEILLNIGKKRKWTPKEINLLEDASIFWKERFDDLINQNPPN
jgi:hypothetical protein